MTAVLNGNAAGSSAPSGTGIVSVTDGVYDMPGVTTADLAAAFAGLGLSAVLAGCSSYLAFTSLADTSVFTGGLTRAVGTLTGVDNQALGVPVGTRFAVSFSGGGAQAYGGIYIVTNAGSVSTHPVLTRAAEFDSSADFAALSGAGWPCGDSGLLRLSTTGGTTLDTSPVEFAVALGAVALEALIAAAIPASTLTTRGDLLRRGASAAERVALGAAGTLLRSDGTDPAWSTLTIPDTAARGTVLVASAANTVTALDAKTANYFLVGDGTDLLSLAPAAARAAIGAPALSRLYLPSTPVLRWPCNETSGTTLANAGSFSGGDLTITGSPDLGVPTEIGSATRWTGSVAGSPTTEYAKGASGVTNPGTTLTVLSWVKLRAYQNPYGKIVFWTSRSTWGSGGIEGVGLRLAGGAEAGVGAGGWRAMLVTGTAGAGTQTSLDATNASAWRRLALDRWHLLAFTYDGTTLRAYTDGFQTASVAATGAVDYGSTGTRYWMMGNQAATGLPSECLDGMTREAQVYSTALSAADLRTIYETGRGLL